MKDKRWVKIADTLEAIQFAANNIAQVYAGESQLQNLRVRIGGTSQWLALRVQRLLHFDRNPGEP